jgi:DNA-binding helix-hairpin-helix protein with protein kinase domain
MTRPDLYAAGRRLELGKRIGKGGEGEVYLLANEPAKAIKIYTGKEDRGREEKVKAMVRLGLADAHSLVAFPKEVVTSRSGAFAGFSMKLVDGYRQLHELYGVKSRKIYFPKADFRFLVRAAANTARAMAEVHHSNCVIGDVNHSGILAATDAKVALIDADSFQLEAGGKVYPCLVGVPDFTPPELQGRSLGAFTRTRLHDHFGLAVAIFQLLFMGRHPYAGQYSGADLTLDQFIAKNLFAYSRTRSNGASPPVAVATLEDLPNDVADAFERAFGLNPSLRPGAMDWSNLLQGLESRLSRCGVNSMHFHPTAAAGCPWCRMEGRSGAVLFVSVFATPPAPNAIQFDVEKAWAGIRAATIPNLQNATPKLPPLPSAASEDAKNAKGMSSNKALAIVMAVVIVGLWFAFPAGTVFWIGALIAAYYLYNHNGLEVIEWQNRFREIDNRWEEAQEKWRERLGITAIVTLLGDLERAVHDYRGLSSAKIQALSRLKSERQSRQLNEFLDRFLIQRASIPSIGPAKTTTLASFGIESAADINRSAILAVPGFGPATADKLLAWRAGHERKFTYNPAPLPSDAQAQARVEAEYAAKAMELARRIAGGQAELTLAMNNIRQRLSVEDHYMSAVAVKRAQLAVDLSFLGIAHPVRPARPSYPSGYAPAAPISRGPSPTANTPQGTVACPQCGGPMIRRMAKRGRRRGSLFWGCSRYPACRGTRN